MDYNDTKQVTSEKEINNWINTCYNLRDRLSFELVYLSITIYF